MGGGETETAGQAERQTNAERPTQKQAAKLSNRDKEIEGTKGDLEHGGGVGCDVPQLQQDRPHLNKTITIGSSETDTQAGR